MKFRCTICYSFFNHILDCSLCTNYVCLFCAERHLSEFSAQGPNHAGAATCAYCGSENFKYWDVDPETDEVRELFTPSKSGTNQFTNEAHMESLWMRLSQFKSWHDESLSQGMFTQYKGFKYPKMFFINQVQMAMTFEKDQDWEGVHHGFMFSPPVLNVIQESEMSSPDFNHRETLKEMDLNC